MYQMYQMNAGRAEAGLEDDGEDLRLRAAESGGRPAVDDVGEELRDVGRAGAEDVGKRRTLVRGEHERAQGRRQVLGWASAEVLELRLDAVAHPPPTMGGGGKAKGFRLDQGGEPAVDLAQDHVPAKSGRDALVPGREDRDGGGGVGGAPPRRLNPATEITLVTPSTSRTIALARSAAASVRASDAPAGSCTLTKNASLSSSGRKPIGAARNRHAAPPAKTGMDTPARRIIRPTDPA